jgi:hypothetical protein
MNGFKNFCKLGEKIKRTFHLLARVGSIPSKIVSCPYFCSRNICGYERKEMDCPRFVRLVESKKIERGRYLLCYYRCKKQGLIVEIGKLK